jgi:hypothetical protein
VLQLKVSSAMRGGACNKLERSSALAGVSYFGLDRWCARHHQPADSREHSFSSPLPA